MRAPTPLRAAALTASLIAALELPLTGQGQAWIVEPTLGPGAHFASIQDAVDAASNGDAILVRPGTYAGFEVVAKDLAIVATEPEWTNLQSGSCAVRDLGPNQEVVIRGLRVLGLEALGLVLYPPPPVLLENNLGDVVLEDVVAHGGVEVQSCTSVVLIRSQVVGGLEAGGASIHVFDSEIRGATGKSGVRLWSSFLFASGSTIAGGSGYSGTPEFPLLPFYCTAATTGGPGGAGLELQLSTCHRLDTTIEGGAGGQGATQPYTYPYPPECPSGADGPAIVGTGVIELPGNAHSLELSSPVQENSALAVRLDGDPGEHAFLVVAPEVHAQYIPLWSGTWATSSAWFVMFGGILPESGALEYSLQVGTMPSLGASTVFAQGLFVHPSTQGPDYLGSPSALTLLDGALQL
jgi:hypothetical protein